MNRAPDFAPYPSAQAPAYTRWLAVGAGLLVMSSSASVLLRPYVEPLPMLVSVAGAMLMLILALLIRLLFFRFNQHNAECYAMAVAQEHEVWWEHHRQSAGLVEAVLLGAACTTAQHGLRLFSSEHQPPVPEKTLEGQTVRLLQVHGSDFVERERNLAILLALQWQAQRAEQPLVQPIGCYWQGSQSSWEAFVEQMARCFPKMQLPEKPQPWLGLRSLNAVIDQLQVAPAGARILCAGCQSTVAQPESLSPAGEAAVLWLLGAEEGVRLSRGEWFEVDTEPLQVVADRALQQSELTTPPDVCPSFIQPHVADLSINGWNTSQHVQDANFGALESLQAMVVQTLAAWYAQQHQVPCAWLANDPHYTLALGVVKPNDSIS